MERAFGCGGGNRRCLVGGMSAGQSAPASHVVTALYIKVNTIVAG